MAADGDTVLPTPEQVRPALHMLAISIPLMSAVFGACLRVSLSYHQLFHRLDPTLFRILVALLLVLTTGQVACITAETWYILTTITTAHSDLQEQKVINACTQVCTTAIALLCQGFYIERLFATTKNIFVRAISILLWMLSIALFIAWNVKYLLHNGPHLNGDRKYNLGAVSLWALAVATSFVSICLIYFAHQRRLRSPKPITPLTPASKLFQLVSLSIQTFSLLTLNHLASAIGFTSSLSTSSNATAACVAFFFFNLFPGLSTYSIIYTLNQRKIQSVQLQKQRRKKRKCSLTGAKVIEGTGKEREKGPRNRDGEVGVEVGTGTGLTAEDDPSNWRGDSLTNSMVARDGGESTRRTTGVTRGGTTSMGESELDLEDQRDGGPNRLQPIDLFDRFEDESRYADEPEQFESKEEGREDEEPDSFFFTSGIVPAPPLPPASLSRPYGEGERDSRTRGASVQIDEVGFGMNWDALEVCREARTGPNRRESERV